MQDCQLKEKCADMGDIPKVRFQPKKVLKGHINKVNSVHFAADSRYILETMCSTLASSVIQLTLIIVQTLCDWIVGRKVDHMGHMDCQQSAGKLICMIS